MSTQTRIMTALSIGAVMIIGVLAYGTRLGISPTHVALPDESVRIQLIPISNLEDSKDCKNGGCR